MLAEPVRIGLTGCDSYAHQLIIRIQTTPHYATITGVAALDPESEGARYCRAHGIPVFATIGELLAEADLEVVVNPTPIHLHAEITKQCLAAGFPVWVEKPPVATVQESDDLAAAARRAGLPVAVCFNSLYTYRVQQLKAELVAGTYGRIKRVKSLSGLVRTESYFNRNDWAGTLKVDDRWVLDGDMNNPLSHVICNGLFFAGSQPLALAHPATVEAEIYRANPIESEDTSAIRILTDEGVEILSWLTLACEQESDAVTVIEAEKATIRFIDFQQVEIAWHDGPTEFRDSYKENRLEMIEHLCRTLRSDEPLLCPLEMTRPFTLTVNAAFESAETIDTIPGDALDRLESDEQGKQIAIKGIAAILQEAFDANALFSEIGVPWARKRDVFDTTDYTRFPVRFRAGTPEPSHSAAEAPV